MPRKEQDTKQVRITITQDLWDRADQLADRLGLTATTQVLGVAMGLGVRELERQTDEGIGVDPEQRARAQRLVGHVQDAGSAGDVLALGLAMGLGALEQHAFGEDPDP